METQQENKATQQHNALEGDQGHQLSGKAWGSNPFGDGNGGSIQRKAAPVQFQLEAKPRNQTGMPDHLKSGIESLSGMDMGDVRVHQNSSKPAEVGALAYAQGSDIHLGPGQEQHLAHEAWHVVQQKRGQVAPTSAVNGLPLNDDSSLEAEADAMGAKALQMKAAPGQPLQQKTASGPMQRMIGRDDKKKTTIDKDTSRAFYTSSRTAHLDDIEILMIIEKASRLLLTMLDVKEFKSTKESVEKAKNQKFDVKSDFDSLAIGLSLNQMHSQKNLGNESGKNSLTLNDEKFELPNLTQLSFHNQHSLIHMPNTLNAFIPNGGNYHDLEWGEIESDPQNIGNLPLKISETTRAPLTNFLELNHNKGNQSSENETIGKSHIGGGKDGQAKEIELEKQLRKGNVPEKFKNRTKKFRGFAQNKKYKKELLTKSRAYDSFRKKQVSVEDIELLKKRKWGEVDFSKQKSDDQPLEKVEKKTHGEGTPPFNSSQVSDEKKTIKSQVNTSEIEIEEIKEKAKEGDEKKKGDKMDEVDLDLEKELLRLGKNHPFSKQVEEDEKTRNVFKSLGDEYQIAPSSPLHYSMSNKDLQEQFEIDDEQFNKLTPELKGSLLFLSSQEMQKKKKEFVQHQSIKNTAVDLKKHDPLTLISAMRNVSQDMEKYEAMQTILHTGDVHHLYRNNKEEKDSSYSEQDKILKCNGNTVYNENLGNYSNESKSTKKLEQLIVSAMMKYTSTGFIDKETKKALASKYNKKKDFKEEDIDEKNFDENAFVQDIPSALAQLSGTLHFGETMRNRHMTVMNPILMNHGMGEGKKDMMKATGYQDEKEYAKDYWRKVSPMGPKESQGSGWTLENLMSPDLKDNEVQDNLTNHLKDLNKAWSGMKNRLNIEDRMNKPKNFGKDAYTAYADIEIILREVILVRSWLDSQIPKHFKKKDYQPKAEELLDMLFMNSLGYWREQPKTLGDTLSTHDAKLELVSVNPNGDCMYESTLQQLALQGITNQNVDTLRNAIAQLIKDNPDQFEGMLMTPEEMAFNILQRGNWNNFSGDVASQLLPTILGTTVNIVSPSGTRVLTPNNALVTSGITQLNAQPITIVYDGVGHYWGTKPKQQVNEVENKDGSEKKQETKIIE